METFHLELSNPNIRNLQTYVPGKTIEEVQRLFDATEVLKLASNENTLGPSPQALQTIQMGLHTLARYSDPQAVGLKEKLSQKYQISPDQFVIGNGSDEILSIIYRTFINSAHEVILSQYGFSAFTVLAGCNHIPIRFIPEKNFTVDLEEMLTAITPKTRAIFMANPNNPTGTYVSKPLLYQFLSRVPKNILVIIDEAYAEYVDHPDYPNSDYPNSMDWVTQFPNLIVTRTFSKAYGLAGLRVGFAVTTKETADLMNRVKQPFNVNTLAQLAAIAALDDTLHLKKTFENNKKGLLQWQQALQTLQLSYIPSVASFITVDVKQDTDIIFQRMLSQGVIVRPLKSYCLPQHLRITLGTESENARAIAALQYALSIEISTAF